MGCPGKGLADNQMKPPALWALVPNEHKQDYVS